MIRDHYRNTENRKAELNPATFTPADEDRGLDWLFICTWGGMFLVSGLAWWGIYEAASALWAWVN